MRANNERVKYSINTDTTVTTIQTVNGVVGAPSSSTTSAVAAGDGSAIASAANFPPLVQPACARLRPCKVTTVRPAAARTRWPTWRSTTTRPTCGRPAIRPDSPNNIVSDGSVHPAGTGVEADTASYVHMTTFVVGLGVSGTLNYDPNYKAGAGDFGCDSQRREDLAGLARSERRRRISPNGNFTQPERLEQPEVDRRLLAHRGRRPRHVLQRDRSELRRPGPGHRAVDRPKGVNGAGAADAVSNLQPVNGDNFALLDRLCHELWTGDLQRVRSSMWAPVRSARPLSGRPRRCSNSRVSATAATTATSTCSMRRIAAAVNGLVDFTLGHLRSAMRRRCRWRAGDRRADHDGANGANVQHQLDDSALSQYFDMTTAQRAAATRLRAGQLTCAASAATRSCPTSPTKLFRARSGVLGDIVDSQPVYVQSRSPTTSTPATRTS